jgi:multidrug transporter EmrE-like cation transporter
MSAINMAFFAVAVFAQVIAVGLLPRTQGFTQPVWTVLCCVLFVIGVGALARLSYRGIELGILVPIMSVFIPLATILIGIIFYGESTSPVKLSLLGVSCVLIGIAAARA